MVCSFSGIRNKEVVDLRSGLKIGFVDDIELIGEDIILVNFEQKSISTKTRSYLVENLLK